MDRQIVYPGQILPETSLLQMAKDSMIGLSKLSAAVLGTSTMANGFAVTPTGPASLQVVCAPGEIYSLASIDALAFSTLPADTTHSIMKQGVLLDGVTLSCPAPGTTGQSINYLVQVTYQDSDSTPVLLPYYNSANPALPYSGMGNNGLTQNTNRKGIAVVAVKAGASAVTGSQVTPAPDAGYIGLYVVTVAYGQTTITAGSISQYSGAPLLPSGLLQAVQNGTATGATDIGAANAYAANFTPAITTLADKMVLCIKAANANTAASTFTPAPGVIAASPIVGGAHTALQGGEIVATGDVWLQWNSSIGSGSWMLIASTGGAQQVATATKSLHAMQLGQAVGRLIGVQKISSSATYTPTAGTTSVVVEVVGGGGAGGGAAAAAASQVSIGAGGHAGSYGKSRLTSGFSGVFVTIGAGGAGVVGGAGGDGGTSSFGGLISAPGGKGALAGASSAPTYISINALTLAQATGGNIMTSAGWPGGAGVAASTTQGGSGIGGGSIFGGGGPTAGMASGSQIAGSGGLAPGAGGSGATSSNGGAAAAGGAGIGGVVIIQEYA